MAKQLIHVEIVAALPKRQVLIGLDVPSGTTLEEAVLRSGIAGQLAELDIEPQRLGIFGRVRLPDTVLRDGDRVEIYRPLTADPKVVRRQLAELQRSRKR